MASKSPSLKLLIDVKEQRVLFAEAEKSFVDFLFSILSLPVSTVIQLLTKQAMVGSLGNLYGSVESMKNAYFQSELDKGMLLQPKLPVADVKVPFLLPDIGTSMPDQYYLCNYTKHGITHPYVSKDPTALCPSCKGWMNRYATFVQPQNNESKPSTGEDKGYVVGVVTYMVMDDLVVEPMSTISGIPLLNKFNVKDLSALDEKVVDLGMDEALKLLNASLVSKTVLTDVFVKQKGTSK